MAHLLALGAVVLVASCTFDLDTVARPDDARGDAAAIDTLPPASQVDGLRDASCSTMTFIASAESDTVISSVLSMRNYGTAPVANVGTYAGTVGLFRFDVTMLPSSAHIESASVTLTFAATSSSCTPS